MQVARKAIQQFLQKRQGLQKCQDAPSQFGSGGRGGHAGLAAGIGGKLRRMADLCRREADRQADRAARAMALWPRLGGCAGLLLAILLW